MAPDHKVFGVGEFGDRRHPKADPGARGADRSHGDLGLRVAVNEHGEVVVQVDQLTAGLIADPVPRAAREPR